MIQPWKTCGGSDLWRGLTAIIVFVPADLADGKSA